MAPDVKSLEPGVTTATVVYTPSDISYKATFAVMVYNDAITIECIKDEVIAGQQLCSGSSVGGNQNTKIALTNFPITDPAQDVTIMFGSVRATQIRVNLMSKQTLLYISTPAYDCSACTYKNGVAEVELSIVSTADPAVAARTRYSFYRAPRVTSVRFSTTGSSLEMTFDAPTNRAASNCDGINQSINQF